MAEVQNSASWLLCDSSGNPFHCFADILDKCVGGKEAVELGSDAAIVDTSSMSSGSRLEIASASWGIKDKSVDVTQQLRAMVEGDELTIPRTLSLAKEFGDPAVSPLPAPANLTDVLLPDSPPPTSDFLSR